MKGAFFAFATIGVCIALLAWLVPNAYVPRRIWPYAFVALAACTWFCWRHPNAPKSPKGWLRYILIILLGGFTLTALHALTYGVSRRGLTFDFSLMALGVIIAAAGLARSLAKGEQNEELDETT